MSGRDYDEVLRRALHAAAESVDPSSDGLERIRARLGRPPLLSFAMAAGWYSETSLRISGWAGPLLGSAAEAIRKAADRFRPPAAAPGSARPRFGWLRPVAAMATFIFVVAAGAAAAMTIPQAISSSSASGQSPHQPGQPAPGSGQQPASNGASQFPTGSGAPANTSVPTASSPAATKCHSVSSSPPVSTSPKPPVSSSPPPVSSSPPPVSSSPPPVSSSPVPTSSDTSPTQPGSSGTSSPDVTQPSASLGASSPQGSSHVQSVAPSASTGSAGSAGSVGTAGSSSPPAFIWPCPSPTPSVSTAKTAQSLSGVLAPVMTFGHGQARRVPSADRVRKNA